jgi:hypothetical protein
MRIMLSLSELTHRIYGVLKAHHLPPHEVQSLCMHLLNALYCVVLATLLFCLQVR